ncbi:hypothetical protein ACOKM5_05220 [Streptomyces sp. BH097]|uniref:hypothetical protein n=1 Tax=unclassified Streptomyces TaxID=2593676 RepID=UPI003BB4C5A5
MPDFVDGTGADGFEALLGTDFEGRPTNDVEDVIYEALDDPRHRERVPGLTALLQDTTAQDRERFLSCVALTTWAEPAGYAAVIEAAQDPKLAPWYDLLVDRKFSVDNTFAQLALAVGDSDVLAREKGTWAQRTEAFRCLIGIADSEYFDEKLGDQLDAPTAATLISPIRTVVAHGVAALAAGKPRKFDLPTQLVDLAASLAPVDAATAVTLATDVLAQEAHPRALLHAVSIVQRSHAPEARAFAEYLSMSGDDRVRASVQEALRAQ